MARIKIDLPAKFMFSTNIPFRISDINRGKHVGYDSVLRFMEEARVQFLASLGLTEEILNGISIITVDVGVIYKKQGFYGQTLKVELAVTDITAKGCEIVFRISNAATGEEMFRAKTGILFFDYLKQKVTAVPEVFLHKVTAL